MTNIENVLFEGNMKKENIIYKPVFQNRAGTFQISHATINDQYVYTLWTFFPRPFQLDKKITEYYRFLNNALPKNEAQIVFKKFEIEELPYTEGFFFPVFVSDEKAMGFLESELFNKTFKTYIKENLE